MEHVTIPLGDGHTAMIDAADAPLAEGRPWRAHKLTNGRVYAAFREGAGERRLVYLQRHLAGDEADRVRFQNGNPLDCRRSNLIVSPRRGERKSIDKGVLAEAAVCADLIKNGHEVFLPFSGHAAADLISLSGDRRPLRWQVKYRTARKGSLHLALRNVHTNGAGAVSKPIRLERIDGFAIYCPDTETVYYIGAGEVSPDAGSMSLNLESLGPVVGRKASDFVDPDRVYATIDGTVETKGLIS
jgi:hypothetical protein